MGLLKYLGLTEKPSDSVSDKTRDVLTEAIPLVKDPNANYWEANVPGEGTVSASYSEVQGKEHEIILTAITNDGYISSIIIPINPGKAIKRAEKLSPLTTRWLPVIPRADSRFKTQHSIDTFVNDKVKSFAKQLATLPDYVQQSIIDKGYGSLLGRQ